MPTALILNAHQPYSFSPGRLNATFSERAAERLSAAGWRVLRSASAEPWDVDDELRKHAEADALLLQSPVNWMGVPWSFKRYMDEVYTAGMDGRLCAGDGRRRGGSARSYGRSGTRGSLRYMLSLTFNAPADSFGDAEGFFEGGDVDRLFWPMHLNFKFFGMRPLPTFASFDVMKAPQIEADLERFDAHLDRHLIHLGA